jgi:chromosome segregation ATPase
VTLVESFIADREDDVWNDFVAVFRNGPITKAMPSVFIHEHVRCSNVLTWKSNEIVNRRDEPEDVVLLGQADARAAQAAAERDSLANELADLNFRCEALEHELATTRQARDQVSGEALKATKLANGLRNDLAAKESELLQRQEEIEQTLGELAKTRSEIDEVRAQLEATERQLQLQEAGRHKAESIAAEWKVLHDREQIRATKLVAAAADAHDALVLEEAKVARVLERARSEKAAMEIQLSERLAEIATITDELRRAQTVIEKARHEKEDVESRLKERFSELATLSSMLAEREAQAKQSREEADWLREAGSILANGSSSLKGRALSLLPASLQQKRHREILKRIGVFDGDAYLQAHPDVAATGVDPLVHYLKHGMRENRRRD